MGRRANPWRGARRPEVSAHSRPTFPICTLFRPLLEVLERGGPAPSDPAVITAHSVKLKMHSAV
jgi:hypothetical protein